jgi:hypothetical protein
LFFQPAIILVVCQLTNLHSGNRDPLTRTSSHFRSLHSLDDICSAKTIIHSGTICLSRQERSTNSYARSREKVANYWWTDQQTPTSWSSKQPLCRQQSSQCPPTVTGSTYVGTLATSSLHFQVSLEICAFRVAEA